MSLTIEEKRNLKTFWISLYGPQANQWPVNADMFDLTYKLLEESKKCTEESPNDFDKNHQVKVDAHLVV